MTIYDLQIKSKRLAPILKGTKASDNEKNYGTCVENIS